MILVHFSIFSSASGKCHIIDLSKELSLTKCCQRHNVITIWKTVWPIQRLSCCGLSSCPYVAFLLSLHHTAIISTWIDNHPQTRHFFTHRPHETQVDTPKFYGESETPTVSSSDILWNFEIPCINVWMYEIVWMYPSRNTHRATPLGFHEFDLFHPARNTSIELPALSAFSRPQQSLQNRYWILVDLYQETYGNHGNIT